MTETSTDETRTTGWVGWIIFGGMMLMLVGALHLIYGLVAVFNDEWVVWGNGEAVFLDVSVWGWLHVIGGAVVVLAGIGVMTGNVLARTIGVIAAAISVLLNFVSLPLYPVWSLTMIAIALLVMWALIAHGSEMRRPARAG